MASSFLGSERYRELVAMGLEVSQIQRIIDSTILMQRLKILSKWLTKQKQQYWREVTALRCDEFMRAVKANDFHQVHKMARLLAQRNRGGRKRVFGRHRIAGD
eukprot:7720844-Pyramimonas_sp.AAC.1